MRGLKTYARRFEGYIVIILYAKNEIDIAPRSEFSKHSGPFLRLGTDRESPEYSEVRTCARVTDMATNQSSLLVQTRIVGD